MTTISLPTLAKSARGAIIPIDRVARPELEGMKKDKAKYITYVIAENNAEEVFSNRFSPA